MPAYTPYGGGHPQQKLANLPGFNGELQDLLTGHYLLGNGYRAYNPVLMRFNSPDSLSPFGEGGVNAYGYCAGDPANNIDPTGHLPKPRPYALQRPLRYSDHMLSREVANIQKTSASLQQKALDAIPMSRRKLYMEKNMVPSGMKTLTDSIKPMTEIEKVEMRIKHQLSHASLSQVVTHYIAPTRRHLNLPNLSNPVPPGALGTLTFLKQGYFTRRKYEGILAPEAIEALVKAARSRHENFSFEFRRAHGAGLRNPLAQGIR